MFLLLPIRECLSIPPELPDSLKHTACPKGSAEKLRKLVHGTQWNKMSLEELASSDSFHASL